MMGVKSLGDFDWGVMIEARSAVRLEVCRCRAEIRGGKNGRMSVDFGRLLIRQTNCS